MTNFTLNNLATQLTFDFMLNFHVELTSEEQALMILFENLDYSGFGNKAGRPEKISPDKMMLLLVHGATNGKNSCRDLEQHVERDLFMKAVFGPDVKVDYSTISRFIKKYPQQIEDVFKQSVEKLANLGELSKTTVFQDGTKIESRAGKYTFVWKSYTETNKAKCIERIKNIISRAEKQGLISLDNSETIIKPEELLTSIINTVDEKDLFDASAKRGSGHKKNEVNDIYLKAKEEQKKLSDYNNYLSVIGADRKSMSKTDNDATFMRMKEDYMRNGQLKPAYNIQNAVDSNYVVASSISADRTDYRTAPHILKKLDLFPWRYENYCADSGYDCMDTFKALKERNIEAYVKPQNWEISKTRKYKNDIGRSFNMQYVEDGDYFICANGKKLQFKGTSRTRSKHSGPSRLYGCDRGCVSCPFRNKCIKNSKKNKYKTFEVALEHMQNQKEAYEKLLTDFGTEIRVNRSIQVEGRFAFIKQQFSMRRFRSFGKERVFTEWIIQCMAANVVQLAARIEQNKVGTPFWYHIPEGKQSA